MKLVLLRMITIDKIIKQSECIKIMIKNEEELVTFSRR
jgi:hypothetical protein